MLGSQTKCSNCHGRDFQRLKVNRTIQCKNCKLIVEERCVNDLYEYYAITQTEEVHCVVSPDFLESHIVDDIPNDPYCTPGFITAFRMLSPLREPVYAASARSLSGSLAEMERLIGDALFAGYVGYNGRAPGAPSKKEDATEAAERNKSGGDARHTLVAYFEIVELASILGVDRETTNLAIRIFRHTASNTSLRNRNVESLATAAFVSASERRWYQYQEWLKQKGNSAEPNSSDKTTQSQQTCNGNAVPEWPNPPRRLSVAEISNAANLDTHEVIRYIKVVNVALRKQRPENSSSVTTHMPTFCKRLELPNKTRHLAIAIAERAIQHKICSRRNPISVSAAAIYLACQLDKVRKTQTEICRVTSLTEVTLRKVYKELIKEQSILVPEWHKANEESNTINESVDQDEHMTPADGESYVKEKQKPTESAQKDSVPSRSLPSNTDLSQHTPYSNPFDMPLPPPLPPGFSKKTPSSPAKPLEKTETADAGGHTDPNNKKQQDQPEQLGSPDHRLEDEVKANSSNIQTQTARNSAVPTSNAVGLNASAPTSNVNPMLAMMNNPALQAFASAMTMMPQFMMPPPPPPLPPSGNSSDVDKQNAANGNSNKELNANELPRINQSANETKKTSEEEKEASPSKAPTNPMMMLPPGLQSNGDNPMVAMQSMMGMVQAMQAFQAMQQQAMSSQNNQSQPANPWGMIAPFMAPNQASLSNDLNVTVTQNQSNPVEQKQSKNTGNNSSSQNTNGGDVSK